MARFNMRLGMWSPLFHIAAGRRSTSYVDLTDELVLRFGVVEERVALSDVVSIKPSEWPWYGGIGWRVGPKTLGLIGALEGIVEIELASQRPTGTWFLPVKYDRVFISMEDPEAFITALREAAQLG